MCASVLLMNSHDSAHTRPSRVPMLSGLSSRLIVAMLVFATLMVGVYWGFVHRPLLKRLAEVEEAQVRLLFRGLRSEIRSSQSSAQRELQALASLFGVRTLEKERLDAALVQAESTTTFFKKFSVLDQAGVVVSRPSQPAVSPGRLS